MTSERATTTTILFSDLVGSTELMQRAGDEDAQRIFKAHYQLLRDAVSANGGAEVKSLGDGLMVSFNAAADAVRCAITMQQASRRAVAGEHLAIRVGLNIGDALRDEGDYFGTPVVVARRLCDRAEAGQILCSAAVSHVLAGRSAFSFNDLGALDLKGISDPVAACEALYERDEPGAILARTPFVGRSAEVARLHQRFDEAKAGRGGLVMLVGEPGIGKTRTMQEFAEWVSEHGGRVLRGRCFEGDWAPPYGPFAEALEGFVRDADPDQLMQDLGFGAAPIARLVPAIRLRLSEIPEPAPLQPDEERFRLLDAVSQFLNNIATRVPVLLILDDLHWADRGTIGMMRHVARFAPAHRILVLGAYRDVELDRQHPLADALSALRREVEYERILLKGLGRDEVGMLLSTLAEQDVNAALVQAISDETDGNPFFIREVLAHLVDEGQLYREDGQWKSTATSIADLGIPEGVRQVITRRLSRLSADANKLMTAASAFNGGFNFLTLSLVSGLSEGATLDAIDEALAAQLLRPTGQLDHYDFTHALIRHTLYSEMNPSRQVRLHRQIAEAYEQRNQDDEAKARHAAEMAYQYHRSAAIPGADRGVDYAIIAADQAEAAFARDETTIYLRMALELLPAGDGRRSRLLGRLGLALAWTLEFEEALAAASEAGDLIAASEGHDAAADYLVEAARALSTAGFTAGAWALAAQGLRYVGDRRDATWVWLMAIDLVRRDAEDPDNPGIPLHTPERVEVSHVARNLPPNDRPFGSFGYYQSREELLAEVEGVLGLLVIAGEYRRALALSEGEASQAEQQGRIAPAVVGWGWVARLHNALGDFPAARQAYDRALALAARLAGPSPQALVGTAAARWEMRLARGEEWEVSVAEIAAVLQAPAVEYQWAFAALRAAAAVAYAWQGPEQEALRWLGTLVPPLERAPGYASNYTLIACIAAEVIWRLERTDEIEVIERNVREKVLGIEFSYPMWDGRLAIACLAALQGHHDEAVEWFQKAREVLDEQGARPLRAIVDYDEALMYARRAAAGDRARALPLLDAAMRQFAEIGMTGWTRLGEELRASLTA